MAEAYEIVYEPMLDEYGNATAAARFLSKSDWFAQTSVITASPTALLSSASCGALVIRQVTPTAMPGGQAATWAAPVVLRVLQLFDLRDGWDGGSARALNLQAVDVGLHVLSQLLQPWSPAPAVVPTAAGGLQFEWHDQGIDLEIGVDPSGHVHV